MHHTGAADLEETRAKAAELTLAEAAPLIDQPLLVITGKLDRLIPWEQTKKIADTAPERRVRAVRGGQPRLQQHPVQVPPADGGLARREALVIRNAWYAAGFSTEFPTGKIAGQVVAGRRSSSGAPATGEVVALDARCAHKRFPLWEGKLLEDGDVLECAYHGFAYDTDGRCVAIPALHEQSDRIPATARQRKFPLVEQDGIVWLWPGDPELRRSRSRARPRSPRTSGRRSAPSR